MATFSTLVKCLFATVTVGSGVAGAVLGTNGSNEVNGVQLASKVDSQVNKNDHSASPRAQGYGLSDNPSEKREISQTESSEESKLEQAPNKESGETDSISQVKGQPEKGEVRSERKSHQGVKSAEFKAQDIGPKAPAEEKTISGEDSGSLNNYQEKEAYSSKKLEEKSSPSPKQVVSKPRTTRRPNDRRRPRERNLPRREIDLPEHAEVKEEDWSNKNWFSVKWVGDDELDGSSWSFDECSPKIDGEKVVLKCPWNDDENKMMEIHLSISADDELKGKKWENARDLEFVGGVGNSATLGVVFSDDLRREISLVLERKVN